MKIHLMKNLSQVQWMNVLGEEDFSKSSHGSCTSRIIDFILFCRVLTQTHNDLLEVIRHEEIMQVLSETDPVHFIDI